MASILNTPIDFDKSDLLSLVSLSAGTAIARQNRMGGLVIKDNGWNVDIRARKITFGDNSFEIGIIGSESEESGTWLWGWANTESNLPELATAAARRAKKALAACPEFSEKKFMLDELRTGHNLSMVCVGASEKNVCYYRCPYSGGALFVQIEGLPAEIFAPLSSAEVMRQYVEIISAFYCDHKLLAAGLLYQNGAQLTDGGSCLDGSFSDRTLRFVFEEADGINRVVNIETV
ncbi:MAG: DUF6882 domain-containing protein [Oscillospiraceae bacterium]